MRIPLVDRLVDKVLESKPKKVNYILEAAIEIKKGEKAGKVDIPCTLLSRTFSLQFPSGVKYIYGDEEIKEESKEVTYKSCPSIGVVLPDIADVDIKLPLKMGFGSNPVGGQAIFLLFATIFSLMSLSVARTFIQDLSVSAGLITVFLSIVAMCLFRVVHRERQMMKKFTVKKV